MLSFDSLIFFKAGLVFIRIASIMFALPVFGESSVPVQVRILVSAALTLGLYGLVPIAWVTTADISILTVFKMITLEVLLGVAIGFTAKLMFEGVIMAASLVGYQMGFGTATLLMPGEEIHSNAFTILHRLIMMLIFLGLSFHHMFINSIVESFKLVPAGGMGFDSRFGTFLILVTSHIFSLALQFAAPILVTLLFAMAALGLIARTVPQINIFTLSFPVSFFSGMVVYIACAPMFPGWLKDRYIDGGHEILHAIKMLGW